VHDDDKTHDSQLTLFLNVTHLLIYLPTSCTENDPLVDDIITLRFVLSIAKVITARLSWRERGHRRERMIKFSEDRNCTGRTSTLCRDAQCRTKKLPQGTHSVTYHPSVTFNVFQKWFCSNALKWNSVLFCSISCGTFLVRLNLPSVYKDCYISQSVFWKPETVELCKFRWGGKSSIF